MRFKINKMNKLSIIEDISLDSNWKSHSKSKLYSRLKLYLYIGCVYNTAINSNIFSSYLSLVKFDSQVKSKYSITKVHLVTDIIKKFVSGIRIKRFNTTNPTHDDKANSSLSLKNYKTRISLFFSSMGTSCEKNVHGIFREITYSEHRCT